MKNTKIRLAVLCLLFVQPSLVGLAQEKAEKATSDAAEDEGPLKLEKVSLEGLAFRSIGPAVTGGRIIDIDVNPRDHSEYYVAAGHGSVWKTTNRGVTFSPVFDGQGSYSIDCLAIDPNNPNVVWVGTGESKTRNSVSIGTGVYKSTDSGKTWKRVGLEKPSTFPGSSYILTIRM